jgi:peptidoglycan/LPS O-acetylase OafA/YrhL
LIAMTTASPAANRLRWLDGVRGAAALFVVLHHMWLGSWPFFPEDRGPVWLGWLLYGHLAVAVFIVVSGFSLALAPVRHGGRLVGGAGRFIQRRAWRILPAYWAALVLSMVFFAFVLHPETSGGEAARTFLIHGALLQDVFQNTPPNGTFWSIAVEWQIYFVFPLILLVALRLRMVAAVALTAIAVILAHQLAAADPASVFAKIDHLSPQFLALFAFGVLASWAAHRELPRAVRPLVAAACGAGLAGFVTLAVTQGSTWMANHWFWVDMLFGVIVAGLLLLTATTERSWRSATLGSRPAVLLGSFSYSLYLMHAPVLSTLYKFTLKPLDLAPLPNFAAQVVFLLPPILLCCYGFYRLFERPFLERRDLASLRTLPLWIWLSGRGRGVAAPGLGAAAVVAPAVAPAALAQEEHA